MKGVPVGDDQQLDHVREWHQATGQADTLTYGDDGDIIVQFRTRAAAEQVLSLSLKLLKLVVTMILQALATSSSLKNEIQGVKVMWPLSASTPASTPAPNGVSTTEGITWPGAAGSHDPGMHIGGMYGDIEEGGWGQGDDE